MCSLGSVLEVSDEVCPLVGLLETGEDHLSAGDVLFRVGQVLEQCISGPGNTLSLVSIGVNVTGRLASFAAEKTIQVGTSFMFASSFNSVALGAPLDKQLKQKIKAEI